MFHCTGRLYRQHTNVTVLECVIVIPCTTNYSLRTSAYYYYRISLVLLLSILFISPGGPKCSYGFWHYTGVIAVYLFHICGVLFLLLLCALLLFTVEILSHYLLSFHVHFDCFDPICILQY